MAEMLNGLADLDTLAKGALPPCRLPGSGFNCWRIASELAAMRSRRKLEQAGGPDEAQVRSWGM